MTFILEPMEEKKVIAVLLSVLVGSVASGLDRGWQDVADVQAPCRVAELKQRTGELNDPDRSPLLIEHAKPEPDRTGQTRFVDRYRV